MKTSVTFLQQDRYKALYTNIRETRTWESKNENLLGLTIDRNLNFNFVQKSRKKTFSLVYIPQPYQPLAI